MSVNYKPKRQEVEARLLTEDNLIELEKWSGGVIKGIKLPMKDRVIEIWDDFTESEINANMGEVIVFCPGTRRWEVYTLEQFNLLFEELIG